MGLLTEGQGPRPAGTGGAYPKVIGSREAEMDHLVSDLCYRELYGMATYSFGSKILASLPKLYSGF